MTVFEQSAEALTDRLTDVEEALAARFHVVAAVPLYESRNDEKTDPFLYWSRQGSDWGLDIVTKGMRVMLSAAPLADRIRVVKRLPDLLKALEERRGARLDEVQLACREAMSFLESLKETTR